MKMKAFNGFKAERRTAYEPLPAGGYEAIVKDAEEINGYLKISFDIFSGEYKDYFKNNYINQNSENKKWKGVYRLFIPKDDGTERDSFTKSKFNDAIAAFEESNNGYHWAWDEKSLKNKKIGVLFGNKEWEWEGRTGWTTECAQLTDAESVKKGTFKIPADRPLKKNIKSGITDPFANEFVQADNILGSDDDLPF